MIVLSHERSQVTIISDACTINIINDTFRSVNDASRSINGNSKVTLQIVASLLWL